MPFGLFSRLQRTPTAEELLSNPEAFGGTPPILPQGPPPKLPPAISTVAGRGGVGSAAGVNTSGSSPSGASATPSPVDLILGRLGGFGRALQPVADFGAQFAESGRNAARTGALAPLAPQFTQGVMQADRNQLAESQAAQAAQTAELQRQLIEARIGLTGAETEALNNPQPDAANTNVQSTFQGANGNMHIVTRNGGTVDTGVPFRQTNRFVENPDKSIDLFGNDGQLIRTIRSPDDAKSDVISGAETERVADETANAPAAIREGQTRVAEIGEVRGKVNDLLGDVGITTTGALGAVLRFAPGTDARDFEGLKDEVTSFLSLDKIGELKAQSATGATGLGAVNEREFDALEKARANLDQAQSPSAVKNSLRRLLAVLGRIENAANADIDRAEGLIGEGQAEQFPGFSIDRQQ